MELRFEPKFYREHLGEKSDHKSLIQDFQPTRPEGYGLTRYLQDQAFVDEESGNIRTYLIRQKGTGELVGYYSIRAGNILLRQNESTNVISGIELTNFAVNGKYRVRHPKVTMVGARIFYGFIRLRRKTPSFSYGDIRRSETYAVMFTICTSIK